MPNEGSDTPRRLYILIRSEPLLMFGGGGGFVMLLVLYRNPLTLAAASVKTSRALVKLWNCSAEIRKIQNINSYELKKGA